jgi:hypothetical protein
MAHETTASTRTLLALAAALAVLALVALLGSAGAAQAASCSASSLPSGNGYITSLSTTKVSCKTGRKVALAFYACRHRHGGKAGRCTDKVLGYSCKETKRVQSKSPPEIDARVSCKLGTKVVIHTYQQNL